VRGRLDGYLNPVIVTQEIYIGPTDTKLSYLNILIPPYSLTA